MSEAMSVYEALPPVAQKEVNDFIFFVAARLKISDAKHPQHSQSKSALETLKKFRGRIPADFDMKRELAAAREEKYGL